MTEKPRCFISMEGRDVCVCRVLILLWGMCGGEMWGQRRVFELRKRAETEAGSMLKQLKGDTTQSSASDTLTWAHPGCTDVNPDISLTPSSDC